MKTPLPKFIQSLAVAAILSASVFSCTRNAPMLTPTGWESVGEPFDSLTRALDIGMAFDMPDDSVVLLSKQFADHAFASGASPMIKNRAHYWLARAARRTGDETTAQKEFGLAIGGPQTPESDYIRRRLAWHDEDPDALSRNERYLFLREEIDYYENRRDAVMLFGRYIDLFRMMRDIGYTSRQLEYLGKADSCIDVINNWRRIVGPRFNTACTLIDCGDTIGAREICISLAHDPKVEADPDLYALAQYNLYVVTGDSSALGNAYRTMKNTGQDPFALFPIVCAHMAEDAVADGRATEAKVYIGEMEPDLGILGQSGNLLVALRAKARVMEHAGTPSEAASALREYAEAADSLQAQQTRDAVIDTETLAEIQKYERLLSDARRNHKIILWGGVALIVVLLSAGTVIAARVIRTYRLKRKIAEISRGEAERRELAIRIQAEKQGQSVEELETFQNLFSKIRPEFINHLRERCPTLGNSSIRVACYIVMGLDTKEIAETMNVQPESIKQTRWRLRKALGVPRNMNLQTYLVNLNSESSHDS